MASAVDICNTALSHIGARAQIANISPPDGSVEAGYCARFYPLARREAIELGQWAFAKTRTTLAEVANTSEVWAYAYALPADCIRPLRVLQMQWLEAAGLWPQSSYLTAYELARYDEMFTERGSATYEIEGNVLRTHEPEAVLLYLRDITDTTRFTPTFTNGLGMLLAGYLAGPIIKGLDGAKVGAQWRQQGSAMLAAGNAVSANSSAESNNFTPVHMAVR